MKKYEMLQRVLDELRLEAPKAYKSYHPDVNESEKLQKARSLAYIHTFIIKGKVWYSRIYRKA